MIDYDLSACLSPLDFELLSKDLLEAELQIRFENFSEGRDNGIDLRHAPILEANSKIFNIAKLGRHNTPPALIVQCKRYTKYSDLKHALKNDELPKIKILNPARYILTTSVPLTPMLSDEIKAILSPYILSTDDIYGKERLNSLIHKHSEIERKHIKLWISSAGVIDSILHAETHIISKEEVERTLSAAKLYVRNTSFDEALSILKEQRICIISGLPGIGKTTLARMLLLYFFDRKFDIIKISGDISEARAVGYHNRPRFYYYDDFLGQTGQADKLNKNEDQRLIDFMTSVRDSKESVFVLTTREYILNQAQIQYEKLAREKFDHRTCVIDLSKYSRRIRAQILYNHLHFSKLPNEYIKTLIGKRGHVQIVDHKNYNPRLVEYLTDLHWIGDTPPTEYLDIFIQKLNNPVEIWDHAFHNQISDGARSLLFVLTTMPLESRIEDIEIAFSSFHKLISTKYARPYSTTAFMSALKELDGTFIATRKVADFILIRFQNPSIRDFMQYILFNGELLDELISSLVFFEQAQWFAAESTNELSHLPHSAIIKHRESITTSLMGLINNPSCSITVSGTQHWGRVTVQEPNLGARLAIFVKAISQAEHERSQEWLNVNLLQLANSLRKGEITLSSIIDSIKPLTEYKYLDPTSINSMICAIKEISAQEPSDIDDFEILAKLTSIIPESYSTSELDTIKEKYTEFADIYSTECDYTDPSELRDEATRLSKIDDLLDVDTYSAQQTLRDTAEHIEEEENPNWDDDDRRDDSFHDSREECSDRELDSMFSTLNN